MQSFAIAYERFHMDPMKRGLVNQLITTYMAFAMCFSSTRIFRYLVEWFAPRPLPIYFIFKVMGWLGWSSTFGCLISINEITFLTYWSKMWLKRVPNYNHDFLATWLNVANIIIAFFLGGLKAYDSIEWVEDKEYVRRVKVWLILGVMIISQSLVYMVHNLINCFKTRNTKIILPMSIQVISATNPREYQPPPPSLPPVMNTTKYNPDLLNWKVAFAAISIIPLLLYYYYMIKLKYAPYHFIQAIVQCFYVPLIFCSFNLKLRRFILNHIFSQ